MDVLYKSLRIEYEAVARINTIARFNFKQLQLVSEGINYNPSNMMYTGHFMSTRTDDSKNGVR